MKTKILKSKKGSLTTILVDFWSYIAFVLIVLILYLLFTVSSKEVVENKITGLEIKSKSYTTLLNFLKTPVNVDGKDVIIADLIRLWSLEPDEYKVILETESIEILNKMEYEYKNPNADNLVVRGFDVIVNREKKEDNSLDHLLSFESKSFQSGFALNEYGGYGGPRTIQAEQFLPVSESQYLYIVLMESQKAK